jgi:hypothetical protein
VARLVRRIIRPPVVFDVRRTLGRRTHAESDDPKPVLLVERASHRVLLMGMKPELNWRKAFGEGHEPRPPTLSPVRRIDVPPVDIRTVHCQIRDNLAVEGSHPDVASRPYDVSKYLAGEIEGEGLPRGKKCVRGLAGAVPNADDCTLVVIPKGSNQRTFGMRRGHGTSTASPLAGPGRIVSSSLTTGHAPDVVFDRTL